MNCSKFIGVVLVVGVLFGLPFHAFAAGNPETADDLKLLPPYGEIPPTFWQQHGTTVILVTFAVAVIAGFVVWSFFRPKRAPVLPPAVHARQGLQRLSGRPENGDTLSRVSQILRGYIVAAFELPPGESTTTEFCRIISGHEEIGAELSDALGEFLRQCDERKFSPRPPAEALNAASRALELVALGEARRAQSHQTAAA